MTVFQRVQKVLAEELEIEPDKITPESHLGYDLGWEITPDSGMMFYFVKSLMGLQREFELEIPADDADEFIHIQDILDWLKLMGIEDEETVSTG